MVHGVAEMNIVILSMFSTSESYLQRYFEQVTTLNHALIRMGHSLRFVLCEGDSTDDTWMELNRRVEKYHLNAFLIQHHHGNRVYGSVEEPQRFKQLSRIWNEMLDQVAIDDHMVIIVESDLIWSAHTIIELLSDAHHYGAIVAPMVMDGYRFHDVWAFRRGGKRFTNGRPYLPDEDGDPSVVLMDSVGSCMAMPAAFARTIRTTEEEELVGFCKEARRQKIVIYCNTRLRVEHPPTG
jgi:hypothetical protein